MQGLISYVDFKRVLKKSDDDLESHIAEGGSSNFEQILPHNIPELSDTSKVIKCLIFIIDASVISITAATPRQSY